MVSLDKLIDPLRGNKAKKNICVFTVTCQKNLGSVGWPFFFFFLLSAKPEIVVPGSGI